jgi:hypothetical protein
MIVSILDTINHQESERNLFLKKTYGEVLYLKLRAIIARERLPNFLFHLWNEPEETGFSSEPIDKIENSIIERRNLEHTVLWETLSINQKKTLKLILLNDGSNLFNADALKSVNLKTGSLVTKALSSLMNKEIIVKNGKYTIQDIVFKKWLQKTLLV